MGLIHFILNLAALLLWVSWRTARTDRLARPRALTLLATLKQAKPGNIRAWKLLLALLLLLVGRALLYWQVGQAVGYTPRISLISLTLFFRSDRELPTQMLLFSALGFVVILLWYYFTLLLFSLVHHRSASSNVILGFVRSQLGWIDGRPFLLKLAAPLMVGALLWVALSPLLIWLNVLTQPESWLYSLEAGVVIGLGSYVIWQAPLGVILLLHLVNSYVFLGRHPVWEFVNESARRVLIPLRRLPLRVGKVDFAPVVAIAVVFFVGRQAESLLPLLFRQLPL